MIKNQRSNHYDDVALAYDDWYWQRLWKKNEYPILADFFKKFTGSEVLDVGIGTGPYVSELCRDGFKVIGLDTSEMMLKVCASKYQDFVRQGSLELVNGNLSKLSNRKFGNVLITRVLHHVGSIKEFFYYLNCCTHSGSRVVLTDIHPDYKFESVKIETSLGNYIIPVTNYSYEELFECIREHNFRIESEIILRRENLKEIPTDLLKKSKYFDSNSQKLLYVLELIKL